MSPERCEVPDEEGQARGPRPEAAVGKWGLSALPQKQGWGAGLRAASRPQRGSAVHFSSSPQLWWPPAVSGYSHRMLTLGSNMEDHLAHPSPDAHDRIQHLHRGCARSYYLILIESARAPLDCWWAKSKWNVHSCFSTISCDNINGPWRRCSGFDLMKTVSQGTFPPPGEERLRQVPQPLLDMT